MNVHLVVIIAISLIYLYQIWQNKSKTLTTFEFYWQLIVAILLLALTWLVDGEGQIGYKILLTALGLISIGQCLLIYKTGKVIPQDFPPRQSASGTHRF